MIFRRENGGYAAAIAIATKPDRYRSQCGVSLIELVVVLAIVAILAGLASIGWQKSVQRARRGQASALLLRAAAAQEAFFYQLRRYAPDPWLPAPSGLDLGPAKDPFYELTIMRADSQGFIMTAQPGPDSPQRGDEACQEFSIDEAGKMLSRPSPPSVCWQ
jgi:type IV pilus assembly protein PilE